MSYCPDRYRRWKEQHPESYRAWRRRNYSPVPRRDLNAYVLCLVGARWKYEAIAAELGTTKGVVAGIARRAKEKTA